MALNVGAITATMKLDMTEWIRSVNQVKSEVSGLNKRLNSIGSGRGLDNLAKKLDQLNERMGKIGSDGAQKAINQISVLNTRIVEADIAGKGLANDLQRGLKGIAADARTAGVAMKGIGLGRNIGAGAIAGSIGGAMQASKRAVESVQKSIRGLADDFDYLATRAGIAGAAVLAGMTKMVSVAGNTQEQLGKVRAVFGDGAEEMIRWSTQLADQYGAVPIAVANSVSTFKAITESLGVNSTAATKLSQDLTQLTFDLMAFDNLTFDEAMFKLQAGIVGEIEPLRRLGIVLTESVIQQTAYANGIAKLGEEMSEGQKVAARYLAIMEGAKVRFGSAEREINNFQSQIRRAQANITRLSTTIGGALLPAVTSLVVKLNSALVNLRRFSEANPELVANMAMLALKIGGVATALGGIALIAPVVVRTLTMLGGLAAAVTSPFWGGAAIIAGAGVLITASVLALKNHFEKYFPDMAKTVGEWRDSISESLDWVYNKISKFASGMVPQSMLDVTGLSWLFGGDGGEKAKAIAGDIADSYGKAFQDMAAAAKNAFSGMANFLPDSLNPAKIQEQIAALTKPQSFAQGGLSYLFETGKEMMGTLFAGMEAGAKQQKEAQDLASKVLDALYPASATINKLIDDISALNGAGGVLPIDLIEMGKQLYDSNKDNVDMLRQLHEMTKTIEYGELIREGMALQEQQDKTAESVKRLQDAYSNLKPQLDPVGTLLADFKQKLADVATLGMGPEAEFNLGAMFRQSAEEAVKATPALEGVKGAVDGVIASMVQAAGSMTNVVAGLQAGERAASTFAERMKDLMGIAGELGNIASGIDQFANATGRGKDAVKALTTALRLAQIGFKIAEKVAQAAGAGTRIAWESALGILGLVLEAVYQLADAFGLMGDKGEKELGVIGKTMERIKEQSEQWIDSMADAFVEFARTGQASFKELINSMLDDMLRIASAELIIRPVFNMIGGALGFAKGGIVAEPAIMAAKGQVISQPTAFQTPDGRPVVASEYGQKEAVMPLTRDSKGRLSVHGGAAPVTVNVHASHMPAEDIQVNQRTAPNGAQVIDVIVRDSFKRLMRSGGFNSEMRQAYGLTRSPA